MILQDKLKLGTERTYSDEGFLTVPAKISRTGIQEYLAIEMGLTDRKPTDIIRVYRPPEEVFSDKSLSSFQNKPVTNNHPPELVTSKNSKQYSVGMSGPTVTEDGMFAVTEISIIDADSIEAVESGKVELSNGYTADIDWTPGVTPDGENFDAVQRNIRGNHIAIVERGRAGPACRVADSSPTIEEVSIMKITIDGVDFEVSDQAGQAVGKLQTQLKDAEKKAEDAEEEAKKKEDEEEEKEKASKKTEDSLQAKLDDATSKIPSAETLDKMVADRVALCDTVRKISPDFKFEGKDEAAIKKEVVAGKCSNVQMDSASVEYIDARFDILVEAVEADPQLNLDDALTKDLKGSDKTVDNRPADVIAREKHQIETRDAWKGDKK